MINIVHTAKENTSNVAQNVNHVFVVDVSYSMYRSLREMATYLKNNLTTMTNEGDTVSAVYFSGRNQCGSIFTGLQISSLDDLIGVHNAIDKFFAPIGMTSFVEPLDKVISLVDDLPSDNVNSLVFMSDGYDNTNTKSLIMSKCAELNDYFDSIHFVEFGSYADHDTLLEMSAAVSGTLTYTDDADEYNKALTDIMTSGSASKKILIDAPDDATHAFYFVGEKIAPVYIDGERKVAVPEGADVYFVNTASDAGEWRVVEEQTQYEVLAFAAHIENTEFVWTMLKSLGDVALIEQFSRSYTKQQLTQFKDDVLAAVFDKNKQFKDGVDYDAVPADDAATIFDLIGWLTDADAGIAVKHSSFKYNRIGAPSEPVAIDGYIPEFVANDDDASIPIKGITLNENRPNISIATIQHGSVHLPDDVCEKNGFEKGTVIPTHQHRNYTLIRDGIVNVKMLPVTIMDDDKLTSIVKQLTDNKVKFSQVPTIKGMLLIDLTSVPLINNNMIQTLSGNDIAMNACESIRIKSARKVIRHMRDLYIGSLTTVGLASVYGHEQADYLSSIGIRDYGFSPKVTQAKTGDVYCGVEFNVKIKGCSSIPSIMALENKLADNKKLNLADTILYEEYDAIRSITNKVVYDNRQKDLDMVLTNLEKDLTAAAKENNISNAKTAYSIIVGKAWPSDVSREAPSVDITYQTFRTTATLELVSKEYKI